MRMTTALDAEGALLDDDTPRALVHSESVMLKSNDRISPPSHQEHEGSPKRTNPLLGAFLVTLVPWRFALSR